MKETKRQCQGTQPSLEGSESVSQRKAIINQKHDGTGGKSPELSKNNDTFEELQAQYWKG